MRKVSFLQSIHLKTVLIYMLLVLIAMQVIGVYFVRQLETTLKENFKTSIQDRANLLAYYVEEQITKDRLLEDDGATLEEDIRSLLRDYNSKDIIEVRVIDDSLKILGTSDPDNKKIVGQKSTDTRISRVIATRQSDDQEMIDPETGQRIWILTNAVISNANGDVVGAIYFVSNIQSVFGQMKQINQIFSTGTGI